MTGGTYDTFAGSTLGAAMDTDETGLLFASRNLYQRAGKLGEADRKRLAVAIGDGTPRPVGTAPLLGLFFFDSLIGILPSDENEDELKRLKRRIIKDNRLNSSQFFARMQARRQQAREVSKTAIIAC